MKVVQPYLIILFLLSVLTIKSQTINWEKSYGGSEDEKANCIINSSDNQLVVAGLAESVNGSVSNHHGFSGGSDFWIYKLDTLGNLLWNKCYGGTDEEEAYSVVETFDKGFFLAGYSRSKDFDVTGIHLANPFVWRSDYWVVKTDSVGNIQWQKCIGGINDEYAYDAIQITDSGFAIIGITESSDGDVTGFHGSTDIFVVKLDKTGNIIWTKCFGNVGYESGFSIKQTNDGGFLIGCDVNSNGGDIQGNHGTGTGNITGDIWIAKLDSLGTIQWSKCYGGTQDEQVNQLLLTSDGGFYICGTATSNDGDVSGQNGVSDFWLVRVDSIGSILWQHCFGGSSDDDLAMAQRSNDGGVILVGTSASSDGPCIGHRPGPGYFDYLVIKADSLGNFQWSKCLGGSEDEFSYSLCVTPSGKIIVGGFTQSNDYDVSQNFGNKDSWVVELDDLPSAISDTKDFFSQLNSILRNGIIQLSFGSNYSKVFSVSISDISGRALYLNSFKSTVGYNEFEIPFNNTAGMYFITLSSENSSVTRKVILH